MHSPETLIYSCWLFDLWHVDPRKGGSDDSCGWFKRGHHGDPKVLEAIRKDFEFDWDRTYSPSKEDHDDDDGEFQEQVYFSGLFKPNGDPVHSVHAIVLNLFFIAALEVFKSRRNAVKYLNAHLFEILFFAENPVDSLFSGITRKFEIGCGEKQTKQGRADRIERMASCIYGYILRDTQKWWQHPRWHVHHWSLKIKPWMAFNRWAFTRCCKCGGRFKFGECPVTDNWNSQGPRFFRGETDKYHGACCGVSTTDKAVPSAR